MTHHENLIIIAFTGEFSRQAVQHFTDKGIPKLDAADAEQAIEQARHLAEAGQHRIVLGHLPTDEQYHALHHAFPGAVTVVTVSSKEALEASLKDVAERFFN